MSSIELYSVTKLYPIPAIVLCMGHLAKILISILEGIIKKKFPMSVARELIYLIVLFSQKNMRIRGVLSLTVRNPFLFVITLN